MPKLPKFVFPIFLLLFFVAAPALIFFAAGYRFDFKTGQTSRVGIIIVDGEPRDTSVYLDDKEVAHKLPLKRKGVPPDFYNIILKSDGYHEVWFARDVRAGESLVISPVFLLKQSAPELLRDSEIVSITPHPSYKQFVIETRNLVGKELFIYTPESNTWDSLYKTDFEADWELSLNNDSSAILLRTGNTHRVIFVDDRPIVPLSYGQIVWSKTSADDVYVIDISDRLVRLSVSRAHEPEVITNATKIVGLSDNFAFVLRDVDRVGQLVKVSLEDQEITFIDEQKSTSVLASNFRTLFVHDNRVSYVDESGLVSLMPYDRYKVVWKNENVVYFYNRFEIIRWDVSEDVLRTIARYGGDIRAVEPLHGTEYILVSRGNELIAFNTQESEHQTTGLLQDVSIDEIVSDEKGLSAFISGTVGDETGLFSLELRED
ncbi:MAG: hypothetical protein CMI52_01305 [Parcubacteria group bacterium]|nr:hypothetical protein [Parcubacteria group bacterium]|tara:strand:- start:3 stop:1295 length:1293 start_codon:yes stop_codon:yes gene_type:complete